MLVQKSVRFGLFTAASMFALSSAAAQTYPAPAPDSAVAPAPVAKTVTPEKRVYTLADFARFAPKSAYDMLVQVPGFTIHSVDTSVRGLGQASENVLINGQRINNKTAPSISSSGPRLRAWSGSRSRTPPASESPA